MLCFKPETLSNQSVLVCFHANCVDGFSSAVIAYSKHLDSADYLAVDYNKTYDIEIFRNKDVVVVDFSFSHEFCELVNQVANSLIILDHHKTAQENLKDLSYAVFDMAKSGAILTWEYFYPNKEVPKSIQLIGKFDLWDHEDPEVVYFNKAIRCQDFNLEDWYEMLFKLTDIPEYYDLLIEQGKSIDRFTKHQIKIFSKTANKCIINGKEGLMTGCSAVFSSELGHELANMSGTFGATYNITKYGKVAISLRSNGDYDVTEIAKLYKGGGHLNAAGCSINLNQLIFDGDIIIIK